MSSLQMDEWQEKDIKSVFVQLTIQANIESSSEGDKKGDDWSVLSTSTTFFFDHFLSVKCSQKCYIMIDCSIMLSTIITSFAFFPRAHSLPFLTSILILNQHANASPNAVLETKSRNEFLTT
jgi:hypothetical protein